MWYSTAIFENGFGNNDLLYCIYKSHRDWRRVAYV